MTQPAPAPELSVVVAIVSDTVGPPHSEHLAGCLDALRKQADPPSMEIIVPYLERTAGIDEVRSEYGEARFLPVSDDRVQCQTSGGGREHHDELRAHGIAAARGRIVALIEDHGRPAPGWASAMAKALDGDFAAVGGAIENGIDRPLNEAVYLCDFFRYQPPIEDGPSSRASDANVAYGKRMLDEIRPTWVESFREPAVNEALAVRGWKLGLASRAVLAQHRTGLTLGAATHERFVWGRSYAATRRSREGLAKSLIYAALTPALPALLSARIVKSVTMKKRVPRSPARTLAAVIWLTTSWSAGELIGYITGE